MINKIANFFTSLKLTVACLSLAMVLVFVGTLAQVKLGLWTAQEEYFQSLFVYWSPGDTGLHIPVFPGGYLLGGILLINLIAAHCKRFELSRKKIGIFLVHAGLILLLLGQFFTELFTVESTLTLATGETRNYSEATRATELALIDKSDPQTDKVYSIPDSRLRNETLIREDSLPFQVQVKNYWPNADLAREPLQASPPPQATEGFGRNLHVVPLPKVSSMDERNLPSAMVEIFGPDGSLGTWLVTTLSTQTQSFTHEGKSYALALRFKRYYTPYSVTLIECRHDLYTGTEKPKNFSSLIRIRNPEAGEDREVKIWMNHPLRYAGLTYYQYQMGEGGPDGIAPHTVLQVVRNPSWLAPYIACTIVGLGLLVQFLMHFVSFASRRRHGSGPSGRTGDKRKRQIAGRQDTRSSAPVAEPLTTLAKSVPTARRSA